MNRRNKGFDDAREDDESREFVKKCIMCVIMYLLKMCFVISVNESNFDKRRIYLGHFDLFLFPRRTVLEKMYRVEKIRDSMELKKKLKSTKSAKTRVFY